MNFNRTKRITWADIAKGIGITLVMLGHAPTSLYNALGISSFAQDWIYSFHMPLFFVISGYLTKWMIPQGQFALKKAISLLTYFLIYSLICLFLLSFSDLSITRILSHGWGGIALWFIPVLYVSLCIGNLIPIKYIPHSIILLLLFSWGLAHFNYTTRWALHCIPYATALILSGRHLIPTINKLISLRTSIKLLIISICLITITVSSLYYRLDICTNRILPLLPIFISGILGTLMIILFSTILTRIAYASTVFTYIGRISLELLSFHQIILYFLPVPIVVRLIILAAISLILASARIRIIKASHQQSNKGASNIPNSG